MLKTSLFRCTQLSGTLISAVDSSLREALTRHDLTPGYVTIFTPGQDQCLVYVAPDRTIAIFEGAAVVAGRRLAVVVGEGYMLSGSYFGLFILGLLRAHAWHSVPYLVWDSVPA